MKNLSVPRWMLLGADGAAWFLETSFIANDLVGQDRIDTINHETIHHIQKREVVNEDRFTWHGYFKWLAMYAVEHLKNGYQGNKFEIDARTNERDLANRPARYWATCEKA